MKNIIVFLCTVLLLSACGNEPVSQTENPSVSSSKSSSVQQAEQVEQESEYDYYYEANNMSVTTWVDSIGTAWAQVAVEVYNAGKYDLFLDSASVDLETASGALVDTQSYIDPCPQVISPGEYAYYVETIMLDFEPTEELFSVWHLDIRESLTEKIMFPVTDISFSSDNFNKMKVIGRVENTTSEKQELIQVCIIPLDSENRILCKLFTYVDIQPNDKVGFECYALSLPEGITAEDVAGYFVYAFPHQYQF